MRALTTILLAASLIAAPGSTSAHATAAYGISSPMAGAVAAGRSHLAEMGDEKFAAVGTTAATQVASFEKVGNVSTAHPRILLTSADVTRIRAQVTSNTAQKQQFDLVRQRADAALGQPLATYPAGKRMLETSRTVLDRALNLGMAYLVTADTKYAERLRREVVGVAAFKDWGPSSFIDTAEMATAVAISLDWLWPYLTTADRATLSRSLVEKAITPALTVYKSGFSSSGSSESKETNWSALTSNWNVVINSGIAMSSLAIWDQDRATATEALTLSLDNLNLGLAAYGPDGGYAEGPTYWDYATRYLTSLVTSLRSATGGSAGITDTPGLRQTGYFPIRMSSSGGTRFAFGDSDAGSFRSAALVGLGRIFNDGHLTHEGVNNSDGSYPALRVAWFDPATTPAAASYANIPFDGAFEGAAATTLRSAWTGGREIFAGLRTGVRQSSAHQNRDAGTFVLGALGQTWATELGQEDYNLPGYFEDAPTGARWNYYRERAEGQNTLVINPRDASKPSHSSDKNEKRVSSTSRDGLVVANLDGVYDNVSWSRGLRLSGDRREVFLQDEVSVPAGEFDAMWTMHTAARVQLSADGRTARLYLGGRELMARLTSPGDLKFAVMAAEPLPTSPRPPQTANSELQKLVVMASGRKSLTITVQFTPVMGESLGVAKAVVPLGSWSASSDSGESRLTSISIAGKPISSFDGRNFSYSTEVDPTEPVPPVTATAPPGSSISISPASTLPGRTNISVKSSSGAVRTYVVAFERAATRPRSVSATRTTENAPADTVDGNSGTYWATWGDQAITWDLGSVKALKSMAVDWRQNSAGRTKYEVETSTDGSTWRKVQDLTLDGKSATRTFTLGSGSMRYVRLLVHGDETSDRWSAISEVRFYAWNNSAVVPSSALWAPDAGSFQISGIPAQMSKGESAQATFSLPASQWGAVSFSSGNQAVIRVGTDRRVTAVGEGVTEVGGLIESGGVLRSASTRVKVSDATRYEARPLADSYVQGGATANQNYGAGSGGMLVKPTSPGSSDGATTRYAYAKFDVASLRGQEIRSAVLSMSGTVIDSADVPRARVDAHTTSAAWTEGGLTFANRPAFGPTVASAFFTKTRSVQKLDVTEALRAQLKSGATTLDLGFTQDDPEGGRPILVSLDSRESQNSPVLQVVIQPPKLPVLSSKATLSQGAAPSTTHDGNLTSYWNTWGRQSITWELEESAPVKSVAVRWRANSSQRTVWSIETSADGVQWRRQADSVATGPSAVQQLALPTAEQAKFVRFVVNGDGTKDLYTGINEVWFYDFDVTAPIPEAPPRILGTVEVSSSPANLNIGNSAPLTVRALDTTGAEIEGARVEVQSSAPEIVSIEDDRMRAVSAGSATVTATAEWNGEERAKSVQVISADPSRATLAPSGDAYVQGGQALNQNFGTQSGGMLVKPTEVGAQDSQLSRYAFASYDIASLAGRQVESAVLTVSGALIDSAPTPSSRIDVHTTRGSWNELEVNFATKPSFGPTIASATFTKERSAQPMDVTAAVREHLAQGASRFDVGFTRDLTAGERALLVSIEPRESRYPPSLEIKFSD
ncbi:DUF7594 domain-containing protein [Microbacterium arborescens]|uniref:CBM96 family carbohydrate-binding protein n=1 Tax=Microbacterium arborescens TaxID=33883 RepID=UPI003C796AF6